MSEILFILTVQYEVYITVSNRVGGQSRSRQTPSTTLKIGLPS
jgi:hypothetical protein